MGTYAPLETPLYTAAPQDDPGDLDRRPDVAELFGEEATEGTLAPPLEPSAFDAAILAGLVKP